MYKDFILITLTTLSEKMSWVLYILGRKDPSFIIIITLIINFFSLHFNINAYNNLESRNLQFDFKLDDEKCKNNTNFMLLKSICFFPYDEAGFFRRSSY